MWDLLGAGIKPVSPALAGRFFTIEPAVKPFIQFYSGLIIVVNIQVLLGFILWTSKKRKVGVWFGCFSCNLGFRARSVHVAPMGVLLLSWARTEYPRSVIEQLSASFNKMLPRYSGTERMWWVCHPVTQCLHELGKKKKNQTIQSMSPVEESLLVWFLFVGLLACSLASVRGCRSWNTGRWKGFHRLFFQSGPVQVNLCVLSEVMNPGVVEAFISKKHWRLFRVLN